MTITERKYAANVGKLFLIKDKCYNHDKKKFQMEYGLCMVYGMIRTGYNGKNGAYAYQINRLTQTDVEWRKDFTVRCTQFIGISGRGRYSYWGNTEYVLLDKENVELVGKIVDLEEKPV